MHWIFTASGLHKEQPDTKGIAMIYTGCARRNSFESLPCSYPQARHSPSASPVLLESDSSS